MAPRQATSVALPGAPRAVPEPAYTGTPDQFSQLLNRPEQDRSAIQSDIGRGRTYDPNKYKAPPPSPSSKVNVSELSQNYLSLVEHVDPMYTGHILRNLQTALPAEDFQRVLDGFQTMSGRRIGEGLVDIGKKNDELRELILSYQRAAELGPESQGYQSKFAHARTNRFHKDMHSKEERIVDLRQELERLNSGSLNRWEKSAAQDNMRKYIDQMRLNGTIPEDIARDCWPKYSGPDKHMQRALAGPAERKEMNAQLHAENERMNREVVAKRNAEKLSSEVESLSRLYNSRDYRSQQEAGQRLARGSDKLRAAFHADQEQKGLEPKTRGSSEYRVSQQEWAAFFDGKYDSTPRSLLPKPIQDAYKRREEGMKQVETEIAEIRTRGELARGQPERDRAAALAATIPAPRTGAEPVRRATPDEKLADQFHAAANSLLRQPIFGPDKGLIMDWVRIQKELTTQIPEWRALVDYQNKYGGFEAGTEDAARYKKLVEFISANAEAKDGYPIAFPSRAQFSQAYDFLEGRAEPRRITVSPATPPVEPAGPVAPAKPLRKLAPKPSTNSEPINI